jgi:hypothetical protein
MGEILNIMYNDYKPDPRQEEEINKSKVIDDNNIHIKPWVGGEKGHNYAGIQIGMSWEKFGELLGKLKFWKK